MRIKKMFYGAMGFLAVKIGSRVARRTPQASQSLASRVESPT
jgi:hypothetical protein